MLVTGCGVVSSCSDGGPDINPETRGDTRPETTRGTTLDTSTTPRIQGAISAGTTGSFEFKAYEPLKDRPLTVWYDAPDGDLASAKVLVVMHGQSATAQEYRDDWISKARRYGALLIVPEFSEELYPGSDDYNLGNRHERAACRRAVGPSRLIEPLFDFVKADDGNHSDGYYLFGHSAGAQFVHRFMLLKPQNRVKRAVSANAGWYTAPEAGVDFPYGLRGDPSSDSGLRSALADSLTVLLGERRHRYQRARACVRRPRQIGKVRIDSPGVSSSSRPGGATALHSALPSDGG